MMGMVVVVVVGGGNENVLGPDLFFFSFHLCSLLEVPSSVELWGFKGGEALLKASCMYTVGS